MNVLDKRAMGQQREMPHHPRVRSVTVQGMLAGRAARMVRIDPKISMLAAACQLQESGLGAVAVMADDTLQGIFSVDDLARMLARFGRAALDMPVADAMTRSEVFARPEDSLQTCLQLMAERNLRFLPVEQDGKPIQLLAADELLQELVEQYARIIKANELDQQLLFLRGTYSC